MTVYLGSVSSVTSCLWYDLQSWLASCMENAGSVLAGWTRFAMSVGEQGVMPTQTEPPRCLATSFVPVRSLLGISSLSAYTIGAPSTCNQNVKEFFLLIAYKSLRNGGCEKPFFPIQNSRRCLNAFLNPWVKAERWYFRMNDIHGGDSEDTLNGWLSLASSCWGRHTEWMQFRD